MRLRHILVVEDSDEDFETVQDAARRSEIPHPIVRATSGSECLRLSRLWRDGQRSHDTLPLLVLLDLNTPGDDGRDGLRQLRSSDDAFGTVPVVVLSASANPRDPQVCYANGANAYHVKPLDYAVHLKVLQALFIYWLGSVVLPA